MIWCWIGRAAGRPVAGSSGSSPTNCGRWISRAEGHRRRDRPVVSAGRPQPLSGCAGADRHDAQRSGARAAGERLPHQRAAGRAADGPWRAVVECPFCQRLDAVDGVADEAGRALPFFRRAASSDAGQGGAVPWFAGTSTGQGWRGTVADAKLAGQLPPRVQRAAAP